MNVNFFRARQKEQAGASTTGISCISHVYYKFTLCSALVLRAISSRLDRQAMWSMVSVGLGTVVICAFRFLWGLGMTIRQNPNGLQTLPEWQFQRFPMISELLSYPDSQNQNARTTPVPRLTETRPCSLSIDRVSQKSLAEQEQNTTKVIL